MSVYQRNLPNSGLLGGSSAGPIVPIQPIASDRFAARLNMAPTAPTGPNGGVLFDETSSGLPFIFALPLTAATQSLGAADPFIDDTSAQGPYLDFTNGQPAFTLLKAGAYRVSFDLKLYQLPTPAGTATVSAGILPPSSFLYGSLQPVAFDTADISTVNLALSPTYSAAGSVSATADLLVVTAPRTFQLVLQTLSGGSDCQIEVQFGSNVSIELLPGLVEGPQGHQGEEGPAGPIGPQGLAGESGVIAPESFAIALSQDYTFTAASTYETLPQWTDSLSPATFPGIEQFCFQNLDLGVLNLAAGRFTCGVTGSYLATWTATLQGLDGRFDQVLLIDGSSRVVPDASIEHGSYSALIPLTSGQTVDVQSIININPATLPFVSLGPDGENTPAVVWSMALIAPGSGGGGSGIVQTIQQGVGIIVDDTDPINPLISNSGVLQVSQGAGISITGTNNNRTITNSGVRSLTQGQGISITGTATNPTITNSGIRNIVSGTPSTLSVSVDTNRQATVSYTGGGGGGGTVSSISAGPGILASPSPITATGALSLRSAGFNAYLNADSVTNNGPIPIFAITQWFTQPVLSSMVWGYSPTVAGLPGGVFTVPAGYSGLWHVTATVVSNDANSRVGIVIRVPPSLAYVACVGPSYNFAARQVASVNISLYLQAGWEVRVGVDSTSGTTIFRTIAGGSTAYVATVWSMAYLGLSV